MYTISVGGITRAGNESRRRALSSFAGLIWAQYGRELCRYKSHLLPTNSPISGVMSLSLPPSPPLLVLLSSPYLLLPSLLFTSPAEMM